MDHKKTLQTIGIVAILVFTINSALAENIDPNEDGSQYTYGENVGWLNFEPNLCVTGVL